MQFDRAKLAGGSVAAGVGTFMCAGTCAVCPSSGRMAGLRRSVGQCRLKGRAASIITGAMGMHDAGLELFLASYSR